MVRDLLRGDFPLMALKASVFKFGGNSTVECLQIGQMLKAIGSSLQWSGSRERERGLKLVWLLKEKRGLLLV